MYLYPANDVLWEVSGPETLVADAFQQLPCAADALAEPTADNGYSCGAAPLSGSASPGAVPASAAPAASASSTSPGSVVSLESLFPATLGGAPAEVTVSTGKDAFASYDPSFVASMNDVLVQHGKTIDDLSVAIASFAADGRAVDHHCVPRPGSRCLGHRDPQRPAARRVLSRRRSAPR